MFMYPFYSISTGSCVPVDKLLDSLPYSSIDKTQMPCMQAPYFIV